jgi:hypothetical protein
MIVLGGVEVVTSRSHSRQIDTSSAIRTGPTNRPRKPMVLTPPTSPKNVGRNGS